MCLEERLKDLIHCRLIRTLVLFVNQVPLLKQVDYSLNEVTLLAAPVSKLLIETVILCLRRRDRCNLAQFL